MNPAGTQRAFVVADHADIRISGADCEFGHEDQPLRTPLQS
jgi:hypothetical protein